jgi:hypothetical protein
LPDAVFAQHEVTDAEPQPGGPRLALLPVTVLDQYGKPKVWNHLYAGATRTELLQMIRMWETSGAESQGHAHAMRKALEFLDRSGWMTPLCLRKKSKDG